MRKLLPRASLHFRRFESLVAIFANSPTKFQQFIELNKHLNVQWNINHREKQTKVKFHAKMRFVFNVESKHGNNYSSSWVMPIIFE